MSVRPFLVRCVAFYICITLHRRKPNCWRQTDVMYDFREVEGAHFMLPSAPKTLQKSPSRVAKQLYSIA